MNEEGATNDPSKAVRNLSSVNETCLRDKFLCGKSSAQNNLETVIFHCMIDYTVNGFFHSPNNVIYEHSYSHIFSWCNNRFLTV